MEKNNGAIMHKLFNVTFIVMTMSMVTAMVGSLIDGIVIGNCLGTQSMAAFGLVSPIFIILSAIAGVFASGTQTVCAGYLSKGEAKRANNSFSITCMWIVFISILLVILLVSFANPITNALGAKNSSELFAYVKQYILGLSVGIPAIISVQIFLPLMYLDSDKSRTFIAILIMTITNCAFDLLNVFIIHGGMFGMALATSISYYAALVVLVLHFFKKNIFFHLSYKNLDWKDSKEIFIMGMPSAVSRMCNTFRTIVLNHVLLIVVSNVAAVAAFSIQTSLNLFIGSACTAIGMTTLILSGIVAGEEDCTSMLHLLKTALRYAVFVVGVIAVAMFIFAPALVSIFSDGNAQVNAIAIRAVRYYAVSMPLYAINIVYMNYFQGIRRIKAAHFTCIFDNFVYVVLSALILANIIGVDGVWIAFPIGEVCMLITLLIMIRIENGLFPKKMQDFMLLPKNFGVSEEDILESSINNMEGAVAMSNQAAQFCIEHGAGERKSYLIALCIEEMAGNIISYGFADGKSHHIDLRLIKKGEQFILRLRDDCVPFNPQKQLENCSLKDSVSHIGIRMIYSMAKDVRYTNVMKMNNLIIRV